MSLVLGHGEETNRMFAEMNRADLLCANAAHRRRRAPGPRFAAIRVARLFLLSATCSAAAAISVAVGAEAKPGDAFEPQYAIVMAKAKTIRAFDNFVIHTPQLTAKTWTVFAAEAPELAYQTGTSTRLVPEGKKVADLSPRKRTLLRSQIPVTNGSLRHALSGRVEFQATLYSRTLVRREPGQSYPPAEKLSQFERQCALAETPTLDFSNETFQRWLRAKDLRKKPGEADLDFGRRVFLAITRSYRYQYADGMDRHASYTCQQHTADCGGLCALFAATLRTSKVPARLRVGHWAKSENPRPPAAGHVAHKAHVKAEFYANGVGWVPVDVSGAVEFDKTAEGLRYFGNDKGDFLTVHLDYDAEFDSTLWGVKSVRHLQSVHYYVRGDGNMDGAAIDRNWQVETVP
ncbi:MAG TPA: transglutaminase-like domain-containing protein [Pirellulales bacterium]|jgi:transglutaminase-like putative cysteine protease|nr:transglutaminase-like domain-containing protein [Pirellulales bacterium]